MAGVQEFNIPGCQAPKRLELKRLGACVTGRAQPRNQQQHEKRQTPAKEVSDGITESVHDGQTIHGSASFLCMREPSIMELLDWRGSGVGVKPN